MMMMTVPVWLNSARAARKGLSVHFNNAMFRFAAAWLATAAASGLVDHPIAGDSIVYLDGSGWTANTPTVGPSGLTIPASVPGDLITDLFNAKVIPEPLFELNWKNASIWTDNVWTYSTTFTANADQLAAVSK